MPPTQCPSLFSIYRCPSRRCDTLQPVTVYFGGSNRRLAEAERPFTHDVARGNLCAFVAGRADEADLCEVTVKSIQHFNPGVRVAVATEDAGLGAYVRWVQQVLVLSFGACFYDIYVERPVPASCPNHVRVWMLLLSITAV